MLLVPHLTTSSRATAAEPLVGGAGVGSAGAWTLDLHLPAGMIFQVMESHLKVQEALV